MTTETITLRSVRAGDADRIAAIYNDAIDDGNATFETGAKNGSDVAGWIAQLLPFVVAQADGEVVGFARLSKYQDCCALSGIAEHSVYVAREARGRGVGRRLLDELATQAERIGFYKLTSRVIAGNEASLAVHRAAGFDEVGVQRRHGQLDGKWTDCVMVERLFGPAA
jgi:L-amino acid N-acyltransferase YncA